MTDPKPATPATDQEIAAWQHDCYTRSACDHGQFGPCLEQNLFARIAADAEKLLAAEQHHRDMLTSVGEEATRQLAAKDEEIERLKGVHRAWINEDQASAELATAREQVRTLREALKAALGHCDCSDYHGKALIRCTEAKPCAGCHTTRTGQAALAATEPKG